MPSLSPSDVLNLVFPTTSPSALPSTQPSEFDGLATCADENGTFTVYGRDRDCTWLAGRDVGLQIIVCDEDLSAFDKCHFTCGAVNDKHPCHPNFGGN